jgi:hypothetical protein
MHGTVLTDSSFPGAESAVRCTQIRYQKEQSVRIPVNDSGNRRILFFTERIEKSIFLIQLSGIRDNLSIQSIMFILDQIAVIRRYLKLELLIDLSDLFYI